MPRQVDLYRQLATVSNSPTNQISFKTLSNIVGQNAPNLAQLLEKVVEDAGTELLTLIDDVTGLNLVGWAADLKALFPDGGDLLANLTTFISDLSSGDLSGLLEALFGEDSIGSVLLQDIIPALEADWEGTIAYQLITDILGGDSLGADVGAIATILFGGLTTAEHVLASAIENVLGGTDLGADVQAIVDKLANAWGNSGVGHTLTELLSYAESIPHTVITDVLGGTDIGADIQAIVDNIANALGHTGTGHTLANLLSFLESIPNANLTAVLGSANLGADLQAVVDKIANGLGQTGTGHTLANLLSYMGGLAPVLGSASLGADVQAIVDKIANALGNSGTGHTLANLLSFIESIPSGNILAPVLPVPPAFDAVASATVTVATSPITWSHTATAGADVFVIVDAVSTRTVSSITYGGTTMTLLSPSVSLNNSSTNGELVIAHLAGVAGGSKTVSVTFNSSAFATCCSISYTNVSAVGTVSTTFGSSTSPSQALTCSSNQLILSALGGGVSASASAPSGGTLRLNANSVNGATPEAALVVQESATSATFGDTLSASSPWGAAGVVLTGIAGNGASAFANSLIPAILGGANLGADVQAIVDNIANALGQSGTGHTLANLLSYLESIPSGNLAAVLGSANLGADVQAIVDKLANAFGQSGTGHTLANLLAYAESIPNGNITNILGSANLGADLQAVVDKIANGLGNTGTGHTLANLLSYMGGLAPVLGGATLAADVQAIVDKIANAMGQTGTGHTLANLLTYLEAIPNGNVSAILGSANLGADLQAVVDKIANGLGQTGTGHTLANLLTYMGGLAPVLGSSTLGADVQAIVDKISNALGQSGTGHTLANLLSYLESIPNGNLTAVLGSANLGADVQAVVDKISNGLGNTGTGHTLANLLSYTGGLAPVLGSSTLGADVQAVVSTLVNAWGASGTGSLSQLVTFANEIPNNNILSQFSNSNIGEDIQQILDTAINAITGGSGTGNPPGALGSALTQQPQANIVIPPNPGTGTVTHDANANQSATGSTDLLSMHWTHTAASTANVVIVRLAYYCADTFSLGGSISQGVKWASNSSGTTGVPMQLIGSYQNDFIYQTVWALFYPATGSQTVFVEVDFTGQHATPLDVMAASSDTYIGVQSIGGVTTATGATTSMSMTLSGATGDMALNAFAAIPSTGMSSYNQTTRYNSTELDSGVEPFVFLAGDAAGASSVTFSGTAAAATAWTGVAFNLTPLTASEIGSGSYATNTSTTATSCSTGKNVLPASFYTNVQLTDDLTYTASTNEVTVTYAGWYSVTISILLGATGNSFGTCLFQNGTAVQVGTTYSSSGVTTIGDGPYQSSFIIYLSAGDSVQAGYQSGGTSNKVAGEATGTESYFSVSLMNRSVY